VSLTNPDPLQLLWQHQTSGTAMSWAVTTTGQTAATNNLLSRPNPTDQWRLSGAADFDRDGLADQIWRHQPTGNLQLWLGNATGTNPTIVQLPQVPDLQWQIEGIADFNGDRQLDIFWRHQTVGANQVWQMQGTQLQSGASVLTVTDPRWQIGGIADFNQDGQPDVMWRHQAAGVNLVWLMRQTDIIGHWLFPELPDPGWQVNGVADVNRDGHIDLLWRHAGVGINAAWLLQGAKLQQGLELGTLADTRWQLAAIAPSQATLAAQALPKVAAQPPPDPLFAPPPNPFPDRPTIGLPQVDFAIRDLTIRDLTPPIAPTLPITPLPSPDPLAVTAPPIAPIIVPPIAIPTIDWNNLTVPLTVALSHSGTATERAKLSFFLSDDATITPTDRRLTTITIAISPNQTDLHQTTLQLPPITDPFWQQAALTRSGRVYLGVRIEGLNTAPEANVSNNSSAMIWQFQPPLLQSYEFVYDYSGNAAGAIGTDVGAIGTDAGAIGTTADYYRGTVIAPTGLYQIGQTVDILADRNQSGNNGRYYILTAQPYSGSATTGTVTVSEYFDQETGRRDQPTAAIGRDYLGSESGYRQPRQSNTDRFGLDFYEADQWLTPPPAPTVGTANRSTNPDIQALINPFSNYWDTRANGGIITYSFYENTGVPYAGAEIVSAVSDAIKRNVRRILSDLERSLPLRFVEVLETATTTGVIRYLTSDGEGTAFYAYTYYPGPTIGSDVHLSRASANQAESGFGAAPGSYGYRALLHETLHALGLKHPGNYDAGAGDAPPPFLSPGLDNTTNTVMSYNSAGFNEITPMPYDRQALQYLYGTANSSLAATTYTFSSLDNYRVGAIAFGAVDRPTKQSIWDGGGEDTLDFSQLTIARDHRFDLRPGGMLTAQAAYNSRSYRDLSDQKRYFTSEYGTAIANDTIIENLVNATGNDFIIANSAANKFLGYRLGRSVGQDVIARSESADQVVLADYDLADLTVAVNDNELLIRLANDGTLRILDYFVQPLDIRLNGVSYRYDRQRGWIAADQRPNAAARPSVKPA
jgi:FG-GAP-like repeat